MSAFSKRAELVLDAFHAACVRADLAGRVRHALEREDRSRDAMVVIAAGKAATSMFAGVENFSRALVVIPRGSPAPQNDPRVTVIEASHPLPDESSVRAARAALDLASSDSTHERLFLISGGASSLLSAPSVALDRKRDIVDALLRADASITEVNTVRRHLSHVKGGALALACGHRARRTFIVSDVIGGEAHDVASGPTVRDPTTIEDAKRIAARYEIALDLPWIETSKHDERFDVIAKPEMFGAWMREELTQRGIQNARVEMCEPRVRIPEGAGRGGRCTHAAAVASLTLAPGALFAAIATDGVDGNSGTAGAIVESRLDGAREAIARFDTAALHVAAKTAIPSAPTGINFADVHVSTESQL